MRTERMRHFVLLYMLQVGIITVKFFVSVTRKLHTVICEVEKRLYYQLMLM